MADVYLLKHFYKLDYVRMGRQSLQGFDLSQILYLTVKST